MPWHSHIIAYLILVGQNFKFNAGHLVLPLASLGNKNHCWEPPRGDLFTEQTDNSCKPWLQRNAGKVQTKSETLSDPNLCKSQLLLNRANYLPRFQLCPFVRGASKKLQRSGSSNNKVCNPCKLISFCRHRFGWSFELGQDLYKNYSFFILPFFISHLTHFLTFITISFGFFIRNLQLLIGHDTLVWETKMKGNENHIHWLSVWAEWACWWISNIFHYLMMPISITSYNIPHQKTFRCSEGDWVRQGTSCSENWRICHLMPHSQ